jgi:hypothetical protein
MIARHLILWLLCLAAAIVSLAWQFVAIFTAKRRAVRIAVGFDQTANAAFGGDEDETISSRAWRLRDDTRWSVIRRLIDAGFGDEHHCLNAYMDERAKHGRG